MRALLISNPLSGNYNYNSKKIYTLINTLSEYKIKEYKLEKNENIKNIISKVDYNEYQILLFAFGDGTINSACNALLEREDYEKFKIGIIPVGTANILSIELKVDSIKRATKAILSGKTKKIHIGELHCNNKVKNFVLMASAGFDSVVVNNINEELKSKIGKFAYIFEFIKVLIRKNFKEIVTTVNNNSYTNILTCVSNGKYYGAKIAITNSNISENNFDVIIIKRFSILSMLKYLIIKKSKNILNIKSNNVEINSYKSDYPLQIDGDYYCNLPVEIKTSDKFLNLFYND